MSDISHVGSACSLTNLDAQDKQLPSSSHSRSQTVDMVLFLQIHFLFSRIRIIFEI